MPGERVNGPVHLGITRDRIIRAAVEIVERDGEDGLSMRRVAAELGASPMSLYHHVPNKAALLDGMAAYILSTVGTGLDPEMHWSERARAFTRAYRKMSSDYPRAAALVHTRKVESSAAIRPIEDALALGEDAGFDGQTSVRIMRALFAYALGAQVRDFEGPAMLGAQSDDKALDRLDPAEFPHVFALRDLLFEGDPEGDFEFGLDLLISSLIALSRENR